MYEDEDEDEHFSLDLWIAHVHGGDLEAAIEGAAQGAPQGAPWLFAELVRRRDEFGLSSDDFADSAASAWVEPGDLWLERDFWRDLFEAAGYREDDEPADRPSEPLVLYRGAEPQFRSNWSWTERPDIAVLYASGRMLQGAGVIWRADVAPERLLTRVNNWGEHDEYIVDTVGLPIEPYALRCGCPTDLAPFRGPDREAQIALDIHELVTCTR